MADRTPTAAMGPGTRAARRTIETAQAAEALTAPPLAADLYCDIVEAKPQGWRTILPGLRVVGLGGLAAGFLAAHSGAPLTLLALLVGLSMNFLGADDRLRPGLGFAAGTLLRCGIVMIGARVTMAEFVALGPVALCTILLIVGAVILAGAGLARLFRYDVRFGILVGGAVGICGASAALGIAALLGDRRVPRAQLAMVLIGISAASAMAMFFYPIVAREIGLTDRQAGFFLGAAIHDVAQALGAGYAFSNAAGAIATIVKLTRVALLAPVLIIIGLMMRDSGQPDRTGVRIPWFVSGFFALAAINSLGAIPSSISEALAHLGAILIVLSLIGAAIQSPIAQIGAQAKSSLVIIGLTTLFSASLCLAIAKWII